MCPVCALTIQSHLASCVLMLHRFTFQRLPLPLHTIVFLPAVQLLEITSVSERCAAVYLSEKYPPLWT